GAMAASLPFSGSRSRELEPTMRTTHYLLISSALVACTTDTGYSQAQAPYAGQAYAPAETYPLDEPISEPYTDDSTYAYDPYAYDYQIGPEYVDVSAPPAGSAVPDVTIFYDQL